MVGNFYEIRRCARCVIGDIYDRSDGAYRDIAIRKRLRDLDNLKHCEFSGQHFTHGLVNRGVVPQGR
ncbi:MAG: hypothetical protein PVSMB8_04910 [Vulcanimicrobiaceae bacterium]